jgi:1-acyl-sn-glycerol-3-phosphate acyltransferase
MKIRAVSDRDNTKEHMKLYWTWKYCLTRILHTQRVRVSGLHHLPKQGGGLLAANHLNWKDVLFIATRAPRPIHYVATNQLFDEDLCTGMLYQYALEKLGPRLAPLTKRMCSTLARRIVPGVKKIGTIPTTRRHNDKRMFHTLTQSLRDGKLVCIFAEGGTGIPGKLRRFKKAAAKVIYDLHGEGLHGIPVVPTLVVGTEKFFLPGRKLGLHFGPPLYIGDQILDGSKQTIAHFTQSMEDSVRRLLKYSNPLR